MLHPYQQMPLLLLLLLLRFCSYCRAELTSRSGKHLRGEQWNKTETLRRTGTNWWSTSAGLNALHSASIHHGVRLDRCFRSKRKTEFILLVFIWVQLTDGNKSETCVREFEEFDSLADGTSGWEGEQVHAVCSVWKGRRGTIQARHLNCYHSFMKPFTLFGDESTSSNFTILGYSFKHHKKYSKFSRSCILEKNRK